MAKKSSATPSASDKTTTYSTRLNDDQKQSLETAAQIAGVSASRFIRDATLRAAADIENAAAPNDRAIAHLAKRLADTLLNQRVHIRYDDEAGEHDERALVGSSSWTELPKVESILPGEQCTASAIRVDRLTSNEVSQLADMAHACPLALSSAIISALTGASEPAPTFVTKSDPIRLLND